MAGRYRVLEVGRTVLETDDLDEAREAAAKTNDEIPDECGDGCASVLDTVTDRWVTSD